MTENESDSGRRINFIIQNVLANKNGEWEWFWAQNHSHYPSGQNLEIRDPDPRYNKMVSEEKLKKYVKKWDFWHVKRGLFWNMKEHVYR